MEEGEKMRGQKTKRGVRDERRGVRGHYRKRKEDKRRGTGSGGEGVRGDEAKEEVEQGNRGWGKKRQEGRRGQMKGHER